MELRSLAEAFAFRRVLAGAMGKLFGNKRDFYRALGYPRVLTAELFRAEYTRNAVANRIVKAFPAGTWRGGFEIIEDQNPEQITPFEAAYVALDRRLNITDKFRRTDNLAGIGRYGVLYIGAPGEPNTPLVRVKGPEEIMFLQPFGEDDAKIATFEDDIRNPRYGMPVMYDLTRSNVAANGTVSRSRAFRVHYTRVQHISDGLLDDNIYGEPRLECVFNRLMDLEKVVGGGAEAFWRRADRGMQVELDPTMDISQPEKDAMKTQLEEYEHELRRILTTRGVKINELGSDVADFKSPVDAIMALISAGTGIPQRVLMGSEQGKLAAKQDRANWDNRVTDRQTDFAGPLVVRPFIDKLIKIGALPPCENYAVRFSSITTMDDEQRAEIAKSWAGLNTAAGEVVVTGDEIRERVLDMAPLPESSRRQFLDVDPVAAKKGGASSWKHVHQAADRFRTARKADRLRLLRRGEKVDGPRSTPERTRVA